MSVAIWAMHGGTQIGPRARLAPPGPASPALSASPNQSTLSTRPEASLRSFNSAMTTCSRTDLSLAPRPTYRFQALPISPGFPLEAPRPCPRPRSGRKPLARTLFLSAAYGAASVMLPATGSYMRPGDLPRPTIHEHRIRPILSGVCAAALPRLSQSSSSPWRVCRVGSSGLT